MSLLTSPWWEKKIRFGLAALKWVISWRNFTILEGNPIFGFCREDQHKKRGLKVWQAGAFDELTPSAFWASLYLSSRKKKKQKSFKENEEWRVFLQEVETTWEDFEDGKRNKQLYISDQPSGWNLSLSQILPLERISTLARK